MFSCQEERARHKNMKDLQGKGREEKPQRSLSTDSEQEKTLISGEAQLYRIDSSCWGETIISSTITISCTAKLDRQANLNYCTLQVIRKDLSNYLIAVSCKTTLSELDCALLANKGQISF